MKAWNLPNTRNFDERGFTYIHVYIYILGWPKINFFYRVLLHKAAHVTCVDVSGLKKFGANRTRFRGPYKKSLLRNRPKMKSVRIFYDNVNKAIYYFTLLTVQINFNHQSPLIIIIHYSL